METWTKLGELFGKWIVVGMTVLAASGAVAQGQNKSPLDTARVGTPAPLASRREPRPPATPVNRGSPPVGGGCQVANNQFAVRNDTFLAADNFSPSAPGQVTAVSWSGVYRAGVNTAASPSTNPTPGQLPGAETFTIRFLADNAGVPGAVLATVNLPGGGASFARTGSGTFLAATDTSAALSIYDYTATGIAGPTLAVGQCTWIEVRNTSALTNGASESLWVASSGAPGDATSYVAFSNNCNGGGYSRFDINSTDLTFCINLPLITIDSAGAGCPVPAPLAPACVNNPNAGNGILSGAGIGIYSVTDGAGTAYTGTGRFEFADKFRLGTAGSLTSVCFWGFFQQQMAGGRMDSCDKAFDVTVWSFDAATGNPGALIATRRVGTGGTTVAHSLDSTLSDVYSVAFAAAPIALNANTCYFLTVSHALNTGDPNHQAVWLWGAVPDGSNPTLDNTLHYRTISAAGSPGPWTTLVGGAGPDARNMSFLLNLGPAVFPACNVPGNDLCAGAAALPLNGTPVAGTNVEATADAVGGCGLVLVDTPAVWYTFVGAGSDVTLSTCNPGTPTTDTVVGVYCAPTCAGPFNCVASNDDFPGCGSNPYASSLTIPTAAGTRYYVLVYTPIQKLIGSAFVLRSPGSFQLTATQGGLSVGPPACASLARCAIAAEPFDLAESEGCGAGPSDLNGACATGSPYTGAGLVAAGTLSAAGNVRDFDVWVLPASLAGQSVDVHVRAESPTIAQVLNFSPDCAAAPILIAATTLPACSALAVPALNASLPATGINAVRLLPPSLDGEPCTGANAFNNYRLQVTQSGSGLAACCTGATCLLLSPAACTGPNTAAGGGAACNAAGNGSQPCCRSDYNHSGSTTVQDIFDFLAGYFSTNNSADTNDSGAISVQDIFDYLSFYFNHPNCP